MAEKVHLKENSKFQRNNISMNFIPKFLLQILNLNFFCDGRYSGWAWASAIMRINGLNILRAAF